MDESLIYAITEVYNIICNLSDENKRKIPIDIFNFFKDNSDEFYFKDLNITNDNINNISESGKVFLKIIDIYLNN